MFDSWAGFSQVGLHLQPLAGRSVSGLCVQLGPCLNKALPGSRDSTSECSREQGEGLKAFMSVPSVMLCWSEELEGSPRFHASKQRSHFSTEHMPKSFSYCLKTASGPASRRPLRIRSECVSLIAPDRTPPGRNLGEKSEMKYYVIWAEQESVAGRGLGGEDWGGKILWFMHELSDFKQQLSCQGK